MHKPVIGIQSSTYAEAYAVLLGVKEAISLSIAKIWLELDSFVLVKILKGSISVP